MKPLFSLIAALLLSAVLQARTTPLERWEFSYDGNFWVDVTVPHSCNGADGRSPAYYRGETHYRRTVSVKAPSAFLLFEGAAQSAKVYVNGELACEHKGGYTPFTVPLGKGKNQIEVVCDNRMDVEMIPVHSDFNKNNGLHNPVWLLEYGKAYLSPEAFGPYRLHVTQVDVSDDSATGRVDALLVNGAKRAKKLCVRVLLKDADGRVVWRDRRKVAVPAGATTPVSIDFAIDNPHLWNGLQDPYLYRVELKAGCDKASAEVGFRYYRMDRDEGFFLNGKPYPLRGVSMHQDSEGNASALSHEDYDRDYEFVRELGCNFLRLAHYPHNDYAFRLCDRLGIIVQTEIPWVNICGVRASDAYFENIHGQMREMISALYNHPSIVFWGMWNELDSWGNKEEFQGPLDARRAVDETAKLYEYARSLDSTRFVGLTDDSVFARDYYTELKADYYSENRYHGWYYEYGDFSGLSRSMNWIHDNMGVTNLSEYGVGINPYCHTWNTEDVRRYADDARHVEEYGNRSHESHVQQICGMPWLNFTSLWILFDFPVADRHEGYLDSDDGVNYTENPDRMYMNDKGLVTRDRSLRKDVFYLYKSWWNSSEETVYIAEKRLHKRPADSEFTLTVYSNAKGLTLYQDGVEVASKESSGEPSGVIWKFDGLRMKAEETTFKVVSSSGASDSVSFGVI